MAEAPVPNRRTVWTEREVPTFYTNIIGFGVSPFDITLQFGEIESGSPAEIKAIPRVKVILSAEQASGLRQLLEVALEAFVKGNGPLRNVGNIDQSQIRRQLDEHITQLPPQ